jgi:hypothetical protein
LANEHLRQQWVTRIAEYRASSLTLKAWCAAHDCTVDQMKYWLYKSNDMLCTAGRSRAGKRAPLVLRVGPAQIELYAGFDPRLLREVVHALAEVVPC